MAKGMTPNTFVRLWSKVPLSDSGCWPFEGCRNAQGYGRLHSRYGSTNVAAHRVAWEFFNGPIPQNRLVLHRCDNPPCVNPDHLFIGTQKDNVRDMSLKGRRVDQIGEANGRAKLTVGRVLEIRILHTQGISAKTLRKKYGVCETSIRNICFGKSWKSV